MQLLVNPTQTNIYPKKGVLVKGSSPDTWLNALQEMNLSLEQHSAYPIPSTIANEIYGCFILCNVNSKEISSSKHLMFQSIEDLLFIPSYSSISPIIPSAELKRNFQFPHLYHPDFGWVELKEKVVWENLLTLPEERSAYVFPPAQGVVISSEIKSLQIFAQPEKDILKDLDLPDPPKTETGLSGFEKTKLYFLQQLYSSKKKDGRFTIEKRGFLKWLSASEKNNKLKQGSSKWEGQLEKLLYKNQKETDKLLDLFKRDPNMALKFSIPLDLIGSSRGNDNGRFSLGGFGTASGNGDSLVGPTGSKILYLFLIFSGVVLSYKLVASLFSGDYSSFANSLFYVFFFFLVGLAFMVFFKALLGSGARPSTGSDSATIDSDRLNKLKEEYEKLAEDLAKNKEYQKAAGVYIKLLKNYHKAANVLEKGGLYQEAATIHLKYNNSKWNAAECYEKGKFYTEAIKLYKELNSHEKVGDIYTKLNQQHEAHKYYQLTIDGHLKNDRHIQAAIIYKEKMELHEQAQLTLLEGWRTDKNASNCLKKYFANIESLPLLKKHITTVYDKEVTAKNTNSFLNILKFQFSQNDDIQEHIRSIAYEIIANQISKNPRIANELKHFNPLDKVIKRDIAGYIRSLQ